MLPYLSHKIKYVSSLCIIIVLYIHSFNGYVNYNGSVHFLISPTLSFIENLVSHGVGLSAVPLFFAISGYLFFLNAKPTWTFFKNKCESRFKTLVIPYVLWLSVSFGVFVVLQSIPIFSNFFFEKKIVDFSCSDFINKTVISPLCYQFWYIRDLIIFVVCSPVIYFILQKTKWASIVLLFLFWNSNCLFPLISTEGLLLFLFGAWLALNKKTFFYSRISSDRAIAIVLLYLCVLVAWTGRHVFFDQNFVFFGLLRNICLLIGVLFLWIITDYLSTLWSFNLIAKICTRTFFIFAIHEPMLTIIKKLTFLITGTNSVGLFLTYIFNPIIVILIALYLSNILEKIMPKLYSVLVGGRG